MEEKRTENVHKLVLSQRSNAMLNGVQDVKSFDETEILLTTSAGKMIIKGEKLHVFQLNLEKGEVEIEGRVDSITYMSKNIERDRKSVLKRMFQ